MKKYLSVIMLLNRAAGMRIFLLLAVMAAAQAGMFRLAMGQGQTVRQLEVLVTDAHLPLLFFAAFLCMIAIAGGTLTGKKSQPRYTLHRLRISPKQVFCCEAFYFAAAYLLLLTAEAGVILLLGKMYQNGADPALISGQTLVLACYRSPFLHSILPLANQVCTLRNLVLAVSCGICTAYATWMVRRGKGSLLLSVFTASTVVLFSKPVGSDSIHFVTIAFALGCSTLAIIRVFNGEVKKDEN